MSNTRHNEVVALLPSLVRYARSLARDATVGEDLVHDALVAALARLDTHDSERPLRPWLFAILRNCFIDHQRRSTTRQRHLAALRILDDANSDAAASDLDSRSALASLDNLPPEQREALFLIAAEGLTYAEAATTMGVPIGTIMSRISRARAKLREADGVPIGRLRLVDKEDRA